MKPLDNVNRFKFSVCRFEFADLSLQNLKRLNNLKRMAWALSTNHFPAFHYNKKCPEKIGTFFISATIWAKLVIVMNFYFRLAIP